MKTILLILCLIIPCLCSAQNVISSSAFNRLIKKDIRYAILGDQAAATGVKVDFSKENSLAITGPINTRKGILTLSAQGSTQNGLLSIIQEGRLVGWQAGVNFHVIPFSKKNAFDIDPVNAPIARELINQNLSELDQRSDSLEVLGCFMHNYSSNLWNSLGHWRRNWLNCRMQREDIKAIYRAWEIDYCQSCLASDRKASIAAYYQKKYVGNDSPTDPAVWPLPARRVDVQQLVIDFWALADRVVKYSKLREEREIAIAERTKVYSSRQYRWWTISAAAGGKNFSYTRQSDSILLSTTRFAPTATIWRNWYRSTPKTYWLWRVGPAFQMDFVPTNTSIVSYTSTSNLGTDGTKRVVEKAEKEQHYLDNAHFTSRFEAAAEGYLITRNKSGIGVFGQVRYRYTPLLNYSELQIDAGPTFNVPSPIKNRSVLTLLVFANLNNLLPAYQNPLQRTGDIPMRERWFAGVRVGIPIHISEKE